MSINICGLGLGCLNRLLIKAKNVSRGKGTYAEHEQGFLHIDTTYLPKINKRRSYLFVAIDRKTRLLFFKVYDKKTAKNAKAFLKACVEFFSFNIYKIITDNGREYTNNSQNKEHIFKKVGKFFGIDIKQTKVRHPFTNGMAERVIRTIKSHTTGAIIFKNIDEMVKRLDMFLVYYNYKRKHSSLGYKTPFEMVKTIRN